MTKNQIESLIHQNFLKAQKIYRFVLSERFRTAYKVADIKERLEIKKLAGECDLVGLKQLVDEILKKELQGMTIKELRKLGQKYKIKYYATLSKDVLIEELEHARKSVEAFVTNATFDC